MSAIIVTPRIIEYARESLCRQLGMAAADIAQLSEARGYEHGERYAEPVERFDRTRGLLDLLGWTGSRDREAVTISGSRDRATLRQALRAQLTIERDMMEEDPKFIGGEEQIEGTRRRAQEIEQFLSEVRAARGGGA